MFPALYTFYTPALQIYTFEHADGAGRATDLVIQPFVRFISMAFFPVIICAGVLYMLVSGPYSHRYQCNEVHTISAGGNQSLGPPGVFANCISEHSSEPDVDCSAHLAHTHLPTEVT